VARGPKGDRLGATGALICLSGAAVMFGVIESGSSLHLVASMPEFSWELSLGLYLVVKGFKPSPLSAEMAVAR
jgi:hypothetical protein